MPLEPYGRFGNNKKTLHLSLTRWPSRALMVEPLTRCNQKMAKLSVRSGNGARAAQALRYEAHHTVLSKTYGALAELRRELADSKAGGWERGDLLRTFYGSGDYQRACFCVVGYFE